ncbi:type VI secretion system tip protein VgrG [uncultured Dokdonia sp.]|uniref:type VI secretion system tip protein VgrG n=1 Tax=uncultured Dokdonia sp. TaxID=575653 RepID=UPI0026178FA0|nr:type VI secretion system tip protein VgrG [uncultured Dokdonia sp.]
MSSTTNIETGGLVTFTIKVGGSSIPDTVLVHSIKIDTNVNEIPHARIEILDGNASTGDFPVSSSSTFVPGNTVVIEAGYDTQNKQIFKGIITEQTIAVDEKGSMLIVDCYDEAIKMTVGEKSKIYTQKTDSAIISSIIGTYAGLSSDVTATSIVFPEMVQYQYTDWDFIRYRAEVNGCLVIAKDGKVSVAKPDADTTSVHTATYGDTILAFNASLNAVNQLASATTEAWEYSSQSVGAQEALNNHAGPGNLSSKTLSEVVGLETYTSGTSASLQSDELTSLSQAEIAKSAYSKIRGEVKFLGSDKVIPGSYITLRGVGDRFNGDHFVSGVKHSISDGNWFSYVVIGIDPKWVTPEKNTIGNAMDASSNGIQGLYNGTVVKIDSDPTNQFRVQVHIPMLHTSDTDNKVLWARLSNFYASSGAGAFFFPEIGDEVIVGFVDSNTRFPVILGSLYSTPNNQPAAGLEPNADNSIKAIVSKSGIKLAFDDTQKALSIETPNNNTIVLSDQDKTMTLKDQNDNSIVMSEEGITIKSASNIVFDAQENITLKGATGIAIDASGGDINTTALNIKQSAAVQYSAEGNATAQVVGGGELTLKAAMVMIN